MTHNVLGGEGVGGLHSVAECEIVSFHFFLPIVGSAFGYCTCGTWRDQEVDWAEGTVALSISLSLELRVKVDDDNQKSPYVQNTIQFDTLPSPVIDYARFINLRREATLRRKASASELNNSLEPSVAIRRSSPTKGIPLFASRAMYA